MDSDEGNSMRMEVADTVRVHYAHWKTFSGMLCDRKKSTKKGRQTEQWRGRRLFFEQMHISKNERQEQKTGCKWDEMAEVDVLTNKKGLYHE